MGDLLLGQAGDGGDPPWPGQDLKAYVKGFGERVIGYGHFVSDDGRDTLGTSFFMQLDDRAAADAFVAGEPMSKAGVYQRVEIHRWSNSFGKRAADYRRKGLQQFLCTGPKTGTPEFFRDPARHESYFASYGDSFIFRGPIRSADGADNIGTALLLELPDRAAADKFWNEEPFARNGDISGTRGSRGGCSAIDRRVMVAWLAQLTLPGHDNRVSRTSERVSASEDPGPRLVTASRGKPRP